MEDTRVVFGGFETDLRRLKDFRDEFVPVTWGMTEAVQWFLKLPVGSRAREGASKRRFNDGQFGVGKGGLNKGKLTVALFEGAFVVDGHRSQEANHGDGYYRREAVWFSLGSRVMVA